MKNQLLSLIAALFLTTTLVVANNGQPISNKNKTQTNSEFISLNKLSVVKIQGQTINYSDNTVRCMIVTKPNDCVTVRRQEGRGGVLYVHNQNGAIIQRFKILGFNVEDGYISGYNYLDILFEKARINEGGGEKVSFDF